MGEFLAPLCLLTLRKANNDFRQYKHKQQKQHQNWVLPFLLPYLHNASRVKRIKVLKQALKPKVCSKSYFKAPVGP